MDFQWKPFKDWLKELSRIGIIFERKKEGKKEETFHKHLKFIELVIIK